MKLYYIPVSTYSQKVVMAFHEKGVAFEPEIVALQDPAARAEYEKVYPLGKIPLLVLDDGHMIPESSIIIEWLDGHQSSGPRLIPTEPDLARQTRFHDRMIDLYLQDSITTLLFQSWKPESERNTDLIATAEKRAGIMYRFLEERLEKRDWLMGDDFSMADCAAAPALFYAERMKPFSDQPAMTRYWERLSVRPSWQEVAAAAAPYLEKLPKAS